jgi:hypothetical protein
VSVCFMESAIIKAQAWAYKFLQISYVTAFYENHHILRRLEKLRVFQLVKKFPTFYGTRRFVTYSQEPTTGPYKILK